MERELPTVVNDPPSRKDKARWGSFKNVKFRWRSLAPPDDDDDDGAFRTGAETLSEL